MVLPPKDSGGALIDTQDNAFIDAQEEGARINTHDGGARSETADGALEFLLLPEVPLSNRRLAGKIQAIIIMDRLETGFPFCRAPGICTMEQ